MRLKIVSLLILLSMLAMPVYAATTRMEARVYYTSYSELRAHLGDVLGQLDIVKHGQTPDGRLYLLIDVDAEQLQDVSATGLKTEVTWSDLRDKFRFVTGCAPEDAQFRDFGYYFTYWEMRDTITRIANNHHRIRGTKINGHDPTIDFWWLGFRLCNWCWQCSND